MIIGATVLDRKECLANLVKSRLESLGHTAKVIESPLNSDEHTDRLLIESSIGRIHLIASVSRDPNGSIPTVDTDDGDQSFLADKDFVVYGWTTNDGRTMIMFVPTPDVTGNRAMSKSQIIAARNREYSVVLPPQG